ncbi:MAG: hypothetical protein KBT31_01515 [Firmicutes bacterium]|nr:hypothetical protein [Candidatus Colimorpha enterica]
MKKIIAAILVLMTVISAVSCKNGKDNGTDTTDSGVVVGEWTVNTEFGEAPIPEDVKSAFDNALKAYEGGEEFVPVAYLGSQVVAGFNYVYLCTSSKDDGTSALNIVTVYKGFSGESFITEISEANIEPEKNGKTVFGPGDLSTGKYNFADTTGAGLSGDAAAAFSKVADNLGGLIYTPVALLGTQSAAGVNYAVLCKAESVSAESKFALAVVYLGVDTAGNASVITVREFVV